MSHPLDELVVEFPLSEQGIKTYNDFWIRKYAPHNGSPGWMPITSKQFIVRLKIRVIAGIFGEHLEQFVALYPKEEKGMDAKQYAWLYLVENGYAGVSHSYYGGYDLTTEAQKRFPQTNKWASVDLQKIRDAYLADIKKFGVDWAKTTSPDSDKVSQFAGTFAEHSDTKETLVGTLVIKNGSKQQWVAEKIDISNVFEMMAAVSEAPKKFKKIFGSK